MSFWQICSRLCADTALRAQTHLRLFRWSLGSNTPLAHGLQSASAAVSPLGQLCHQLYQSCASCSWGGGSLLFEQPGCIAVFPKDMFTERKLWRLVVFLFWLLSMLHIFCQHNVPILMRLFIWHCQVSVSFIENPMNVLCAHLCIQTQKLRMAFVKHSSFLPTVLSPCWKTKDAHSLLAKKMNKILNTYKYIHMLRVEVNKSIRCIFFFFEFCLPSVLICWLYLQKN